MTREDIIRMAREKFACQYSQLPVAESRIEAFFQAAYAAGAATKEAELNDGLTIAYMDGYEKGKDAGAADKQKEKLLHNDWKLVPRKATPEMLKAMDECAQEGYDERIYAGMASSVYMAAWDASPVMGSLPTSNTFKEWFYSKPHRAKYSSDHPAYLAAQEAWEAAHEACAQVLDAMADDMVREMEPSTAVAYVRSKAAAIRARGAEPMTTDSLEQWRKQNPGKSAPECTLITPPKPVGAWILDPQGAWHTQLAMYSKPTDEQIKNTEAIFGWKWKDLT